MIFFIYYKIKNNFLIVINNMILDYTNENIYSLNIDLNVNDNQLFNDLNKEYNNIFFNIIKSKDEMFIKNNFGINDIEDYQINIQNIIFKLEKK
jgi:hypothetical protein